MNQEPITVSDLTFRIKSVIESDFDFVFVTGEISNFKHHSSGHYYFSLKDDKSQISALMWSSRNRMLNFLPKDGMKVNVKGRITVYEGRGTYQIDAFDITPAGQGDIYLAFEKLKEKLRSEGLFDTGHKIKLPEFPCSVALITSETGAALQDFVRVSRKRYPLARLMLFNSRMQGIESSKEIIRAIRQAQKKEYDADIIVLTRGGGSVEDLWVFNDEEMAREIFRCGIPFVSAIGHEVDYTIADFVADLRAPTPSAAAEMIFPDISELMKDLDDNQDRLTGITGKKLLNLNTVLDNIEKNYHFRRPLDRISELKDELESIEDLLGDSVREKFDKLWDRLENIQKSYTFRKPADNIRSERSSLLEAERRLRSIRLARMGSAKSHLEKFSSLLESLNPRNVQKRGFALIRSESKFITNNSMLSPGDNVNIEFADGSSAAEIKSKNE